MLIVHVCSGQGAGVPWVQPCSCSTPDPIDTIGDFVMHMGTAVAEAVAEEVPVDAAIDPAGPWQGRVLDHLPTDLCPLVEVARRVVFCKRHCY